MSGEASPPPYPHVGWGLPTLWEMNKGGSEGRGGASPAHPPGSKLLLQVEGWSVSSHRKREAPLCAHLPRATHTGWGSCRDTAKLPCSPWNLARPPWAGQVHQRPQASVLCPCCVCRVPIPAGPRRSTGGGDRRGAGGCGPGLRNRCCSAAAGAGPVWLWLPLEHSDTWPPGAEGSFSRRALAGAGKGLRKGHPSLRGGLRELRGRTSSRGLSGPQPGWAGAGRAGIGRVLPAIPPTHNGRPASSPRSLDDCNLNISRQRSSTSQQLLNESYFYK